MSVAGAAQFMAAMVTFRHQMRRDIDAHRKNIVSDALVQLIKYTPVHSGNARYNWQVSGGTPKRSILPYDKRQVIYDSVNTPPPPPIETGGFSPLAREVPNILAVRPEQTAYITNNVDYIELLENGTASRQSSAMMALTVSSLLTKYSDLSKTES